MKINRLMVLVGLIISFPLASMEKSSKYFPKKSSSIAKFSKEEKYDDYGHYYEIAKTNAIKTEKIVITKYIDGRLVGQVSIKKYSRNSADEPWQLSKHNHDRLSETRMLDMYDEYARAFGSQEKNMSQHKA